MGVTSSLKKTAKGSAILRNNAKEIAIALNYLSVIDLTDEQVEDIVSDVELIAIQIEAVAKQDIKVLNNIVLDIDKYLTKAR